MQETPLPLDIVEKLCDFGYKEDTQIIYPCEAVKFLRESHKLHLHCIWERFKWYWNIQYLGTDICKVGFYRYDTHDEALVDGVRETLNIVWHNQFEKI